ncbi:PIN domain-containing protein [Salinimonas sediminis]|uniref:DUF4935 domain-containing protein n=1 Tax=Salinimonas sediminis TaxID=2303538 RepID=A0A346NMI7_9ALTE|nr:PIN domain-containing protein [Salinimonas sediminis]AXR06744.1 hypothetical protein D0Y50_10440 [Salinimonas sediminis]
MRNILLDTNILYAGLWTADLQALSHLVDQGVIALHVPEMVKREKVSKVSFEIESELNKIISSIRSLNNKGLKNERFLRALEFSERIFHDLLESTEKHARDDFDAWIDKNKTNVIEFNPIKFANVLDDYFSGDGAYRKLKERSDIPDSIIHHTALSLRDEIGPITCIVGDANLRKTLEKENYIDVYSCLDTFFELDGIEEHIQNFSLKPYLMSSEFSDFVMKVLEAEPQLIRGVEIEEVANLSILNIQAFNPQISDIQLDSLEDFGIMDIYSIGSDKFSAKFKFTAYACLTYVSDYGTFLDLDKNYERDVEMHNMNGDGMCELSEIISAKFYGDAIFWFDHPQTPTDIQKINSNSKQSDVKMSIDIEVNKAILSELILN